MAKDRFLIAPLNTGWENDVHPWLIADDAFADLKNAFLYKGRLRNRVGSAVMNPQATTPTLTTRLRIPVGTTDANGDLSGTVPGLTFAVGQAFSIGQEVFTVRVVGAPGIMLTTGAATVHTYNTTNGAFVIEDADATTDVYFYPATPVMGFGTYEQVGTNNELYVAFDTQFAYEWLGGEWIQMATGVDEWAGTDSDFFWSNTWRGASADTNLLFVSNFVAADGMKYWNGATWTAFSPAFGVGANDNIVSAKIIVPFKGRLLLFNTIETTGTNTNFQQRLRYSQLGSPLDAQAWRGDIPGRGNFTDAPTQEKLISVEFIKDRVIVYFERSTYEVVYTGNQVLPFVWQKINTELGVESTFSVVPFDKSVVGMGLTGIHACNGVNVSRIDKKIYHEIFDIDNTNDGSIRVYGIRDYFYELIYFTYPSVQKQNGEWNNTYPNRMLVYDYTKDNWSYNDDSITALGYVQNLDGLLWSAAREPWEQAGYIWSQSSNNTLFRQTIAGNQEGYTFRLDGTSPRNSPALQITNLVIAANFVITITSINHNLGYGDYILVENCEGVTDVNDRIFPITPLTANTFTVTDMDEIAAGTYLGGGTLARVTPMDALTKRYNFYLKEGRNVSVEKVDFFVDRTESGEFTVDYYTSTASFSLGVGALLSGAQLGNNAVETSPYTIVPYENFMERFWHTYYMPADGQFIQMRFFLTEEQTTTPTISLLPIVINGMIIHASPTADRLQ